MAQPKNGAIIGTLLNGQLCHLCPVPNDLPEIVVAGCPNLFAVSQQVRHQSWTKVSGKINGIAGFPTEAGTNPKNDEEQAERREVSRTDIAVIFQGVDQEHQQHTPNEFAEEHAGGGHELGWVGAEDTG